MRPPAGPTNWNDLELTNPHESASAARLPSLRIGESFGNFLPQANNAGGFEE